MFRIYVLLLDNENDWLKSNEKNLYQMKKPVSEIIHDIKKDTPLKCYLPSMFWFVVRQSRIAKPPLLGDNGAFSGDFGAGSRILDLDFSGSSNISCSACKM